MKDSIDTTILEKINLAAIRFLQPLTLQATYKAIVDEAIGLVDGDEGYIAMADENGELNIVYSYLPSIGSLKVRKRGFTYAAYSQRRAYVTYVEDYKNIHPEFIDAGVRSTIFIPLSSKDKSIGVMNIISKQKSRKFSQKELSVLKLFGSMASLAIKKTQLYDETRQALETRDLFISMAAHELRTPLTSVNGYVQLLKRRFSNTNSMESRWIDQLYWESVRLTNLANELLEINRIKTGKLQYYLRECNLREIVKRVENNFMFSYPSRQLFIEDKLDNQSDVIIGDHDKVVQVFENLLDNAVKYSPSSTPIVVTLKAKGTDIIVQVKDQGMGIPKHDHERIFEGFHQGMGHNKEGLGLGLFLVKDIMHRLRGEVSVRSRVGKGTIFTLSFPGLNNSELNQTP